jgi:hypothetical protein
MASELPTVQQKQAKVPDNLPLPFRLENEKSLITPQQSSVPQEWVQVQFSDGATLGGSSIPANIAKSDDSFLEFQ